MPEMKVDAEKPASRHQSLERLRACINIIYDVYMKIYIYIYINVCVYRARAPPRRSLGEPANAPMPLYITPVHHPQPPIPPLGPYIPYSTNARDFSVVNDCCFFIEYGFQCNV